MLGFNNDARRTEDSSLYARRDPLPILWCIQLCLLRVDDSEPYLLTKLAGIEGRKVGEGNKRRKTSPILLTPLPWTARRRAWGESPNTSTSAPISSRRLFPLGI